MPRIHLIPLVVASALFMENLDSTVIATSLPVIAADLGEDPVILKLAFTAYLLSLAVFIPVSGWCADRFGARRVFQAAIAVFTLASLWCGSAQSLGELVAARSCQGLGGAMMVPVGRLIILRTVSKREMVSALAWLTVPALVGPVMGPPVGGYITTYFSWRWIFWINVPIGLLGIALAWWKMPDVRADDPGELDVKGFLLAGFGLFSLILGFTVYGRPILPPYGAPGLMLAGAVALWAYVRHARVVANPILDLDLLKIATFRSSITGGSLFRLSAGATPFLLPLLLQVGFGLSAFASGMLTFVAAAGAIAMKFTAQPILKRYGFRTVLIVNAVISGGFFAVNGFLTPETPHWVILVLFLVGGFFRSMQFTAVNALSYADIDQRAMSRATAFSSVSQQLAVSFGVAFAALVIELSQHLRSGGDLVAADFAAAFFAIGALAALSAVIHAGLARDAGAEVSGRAV